MIVQFGTHTILGRPSSDSGFTSGIVSAASGSMRNALELSMHVVPAAAVWGIQVLATELPHELRATSTPRSASSESTPTSCSSPRNRSLAPAERSEASRTSSSTGKDRSSRMRTILRPTAPVAPTTATRMAPTS
jgi:cytoskeletal protein RodZ